MPQSLARVVIHMAFSTKDRRPIITTELRQELWPYMTTVLKNQGNLPIQVGGVEDHVHLLFALARTVSISEVVENVKTSSSKWVKESFAQQSTFAWQHGYGAFSIGYREVDTVAAYVRNQETHHRKMSFQDEFRGLLNDNGVDFDERYVWD